MYTVQLLDVTTIGYNQNQLKFFAYISSLREQPSSFVFNGTIIEDFFPLPSAIRDPLTEVLCQDYGNGENPYNLQSAKEQMERKTIYQF